MANDISILRLKKLKTELHMNQQFCSENIVKGNENINLKDTCKFPNKFIAALFTVAKTWNGLSVHRWMDG